MQAEIDFENSKGIIKKVDDICSILCSHIKVEEDAELLATIAELNCEEVTQQFDETSESEVELRVLATIWISARDHGSSQTETCEQIKNERPYTTRILGTLEHNGARCRQYAGLRTLLLGKNEETAASASSIRRIWHINHIRNKQKTRRKTVHRCDWRDANKDHLWQKICSNCSRRSNAQKMDCFHEEADRNSQRYSQFHQQNKER